MIFLNYLYFLVITFYGYKFLTSKSGKLVKNPLNEEQMMELTGPEMFWVLTFSTGLLALSAPGGIDLMAIRLMVLILFCVVGLFIVKERPVYSVPLKLYTLFLVWIIIGIFYGPSVGYGVRVVLKYCYPILLALFASAVVRDVEVFVKAGLGARWVAVVYLIFAFVPGLGMLIPGVFWYGTAAAINFISIMVFSITLFYYTDEKKKNLIYAALFILPCFLWVFRTSIMGSLVAIMAFFFIKYKMKSAPIIAGVLLAGVLAVFFIPSLHEKMFGGREVTFEQFQNKNVDMDDVNTNAREAMWKHMEKRFYEGHEMAGSGTGSLQHYMYNNFLFGGLKVVHSDFVQMRCDNGLIGLLLYGLISICIYFHCFFVFHKTRSASVKMCAITAGASMAGVFVTLYSDNVVNYSMATLSMPYGFYGMMLGLNKRDKEGV